MIKKIFSILLIIFATAIFANAQAKYSISGTIKGCNGIANLIDYVSGKVLNKIDIKNGIFEAAGSVDEPIKARLVYETTNYTIATFVLEEGNITINGSLNGDFVVGGTENNEKIADFYDEVLPIYYSVQKKATPENIFELQNSYTKHIKANNDNYAGAFMLSMDYIDLEDDEYYRIVEKFPEEIKNSEMMQQTMERFATLEKPNDSDENQSSNEAIYLNEEPKIDENESATNYVPQNSEGKPDTAAPILVNPEYVPQEIEYKPNENLISEVEQPQDNGVEPIPDFDYESLNKSQKIEPGEIDSEKPAEPDVYYAPPETDEPKYINSSNKYPNIILENADGEYVSLLSTLKKNKYTLVDFWASWCAPCMSEVPYFASLYRLYHEKGFEIYGVSLDKNAKTMQRAAKKNGMNWITVIDKNGAKGYSAEYFVYSLPANFLIDSNGNIIDRNLSGKQIHELLKKLLK